MGLGRPVGNIAIDQASAHRDLDQDGGGSEPWLDLGVF